MTEIYLKIADSEGGHECRRIDHRVTAIPQIRKVAGARFIPTKFAVRHEHMWRRVWERADGSFYIKSSYRNLNVVIVPN